jgi:hypothetical protein
MHSNVIEVGRKVSMTDDAVAKAREVRLRRAAARQGLRLEKSKLRDPRAREYGRYLLSDATTRAVVGQPWITLDEVEEYLNRPTAK